MNDLEAAGILEHALKFDQFPHVQQALTHAAQALRERADSAQMQKHAEPVAWMSLGKYDDDEEWELSFGPSFPNGHDDAPIPLYTTPPSKPELIEKPLAAGETFESEWVSTDSFYGNK